MKAVIIDDMDLAIASLKSDLTEYCPDIELVGTANGVVEGAKLLKKVKAELLFLDIQMQDGDGFDLLDILGDHPYHIIFTTGSSDFAIKAFQYAAVDYLLKPVDPDLLVKAVEKVEKTLPLTSEQKNLLQNQLEDGENNSIALNTQEQIHVVKFEEIIRCAAMDNYTRFFLEDGSKILVTKTLKEFERMLPEELFKRVHQSHLVNLQHVRSYVKTEGGYLQMRNEDHVPVSVRKKPMVMEMLRKNY